MGAVSLITNRLGSAQQSLGSATSAHKRLPLGQGGRAAKLIGLTIDEMAFLIKVVVDVRMNLGELL